MSAATVMDSGVVLATPAVASDWTLSHRSYNAGARVVIPGAPECEGTFRVTENDGKRPAVTTCDECGMHVGVLQSALRRGGVRSADDQRVPF